MGNNYSAWDIERLTGPIDRVNSALLYNLTCWGVLAASTHNAQPWRFQHSPEERKLSIFVDASYVLPESDPSGRQSFVSIGCALENILIAAGNYGVCSKPVYREGLHVYPISAVDVHLSVSDEAASPHAAGLFQAMKSRTMNRGSYRQDKSVPGSFLESLQRRAIELGLSLDLVTDSAKRLAIAELQQQGDTQAIGKLAFRNELANYLLPNDHMGGRGMVGKNFGLQDEQASGVYELMKAKGDLPPEVKQGFSSAGKGALMSSPIIMVVSVLEETGPNWIRAGQLLQYAAVGASSLGVSLAVHAALTEMGDLPSELSGVLERVERPVVLARMGYADGDPLPHSPRVPAHELIDFPP